MAAEAVNGNINAHIYMKLMTTKTDLTDNSQRLASDRFLLIYI